MATVLKQLKDLSESRDLMQQELEELKDAAQDVAGLVEIPEGNEDELLMLAGRLRKVLESFERYVSTTTRQYVGYVLGSVKSYWPRTPLDPLREGSKAGCNDDQFGQYLEETSSLADKIVEVPEGNEDEPLTLAGKLRKVPESFKRYVSTTTR